MSTQTRPLDVGRNRTRSNVDGYDGFIQPRVASDNVFGGSPRGSLRGRLAALVALAGAAVLCGAGASTAGAAVSLGLSQSTAFAILGHSCGGIQEKAYATGFVPVSGNPTGVVYIQTRCGGSGRGGGYKTTTYSAWVGVTWDFAGNVLSSAKLATAPPVDATLSVADAYGDNVYNNNGAAYLAVPAPSAPTGESAVQSGDQAAVSWTPNGVNPAAVTSSTIVATDVKSANVVTTTVSGTATDGLVGPLQPSTTYSVTVMNTTIGGSSPASAPVTLKTTAASVVPSAPTGVTARWATLDPTGATDNLIAKWKQAVPGDSPIDQYQVTINGSDGGGSFTQTVPSTSLTPTFTVDFTPNWTVYVRAHNAAGWGAWSSPFSLGGL